MDLRAIYFTCIICPKPSLTSDLGTKKGAMIELRRERASVALAMWRERGNRHQGTAAMAGVRWMWYPVVCGLGLGRVSPNPIYHLFVIKAQVDQSINHTDTPIKLKITLYTAANFSFWDEVSKCFTWLFKFRCPFPSCIFYHAHPCPWLLDFLLNLSSNSVCNFIGPYNSIPSSELA